MTITEFLQARIAEDERRAQEAIDWVINGPEPRFPWFGSPGEKTGARFGRAASHVAAMSPARVLAECAAKRAIIKLHENWPVLVDGPACFSQGVDDLQGVTFNLSREVMWLTGREYFTRFGTEPPAAPMVRALAAVYASHPDYQEEWAA